MNNEEEGKTPERATASSGGIHGPTEGHHYGPPCGEAPAQVLANVERVCVHLEHRRRPLPYPDVDDEKAEEKVTELELIASGSATMQAEAAYELWKRIAREKRVVCGTEDCGKTCWDDGEITTYCCKSCRDGRRCGAPCRNHQACSPKNLKRAAPDSRDLPFEDGDDDDAGAEYGRYFARKIFNCLAVGNAQSAQDFVDQNLLRGPISSNFRRFCADSSSSVQLDRAIEEIMKLTLRSGRCLSPSQVVNVMVARGAGEMVSESVHNHCENARDLQLVGDGLSNAMGLRVKLTLVHECYVCKKAKKPYNNIALGDDVKHFEAENRRHRRKLIDHRWYEEAYYKFMTQATLMGVNGTVAEMVGLEAAMDMRLRVEEINHTTRMELAAKKKEKKEAAKRAKEAVRVAGVKCAKGAAAVAHAATKARSQDGASEKADCDDDAVRVTGSMSASDVAEREQGWQSVGVMVEEVAVLATLESEDAMITIWNTD